MTCDYIIRDDIRIYQPKEGFRFGLDSVILAWFARFRRRDRVADLGAGSGVISALLARLKGIGNICCVEKDEKMYDCLIKTIEANALEKVLTPLLKDAREYKPLDYLDGIVTNPPYRKAYTGRVSAESTRNARFDDTLSLESIAGFAASYLKCGGRLVFSGAADRLAYAVDICKSKMLEPKRLQILYSSEKKRAKTFFLECVHGGGVELIIEKPLWYDKSGKSPAEEILSGEWDG